MFYTRNVGYQKKRIDPLNSDKVILAVSDVLYGQKRQNRAKNGFSKIGFTICMWGTMRKVNDGLYLDKDNLVLIE